MDRLAMKRQLLAGLLEDNRKKGAAEMGARYAPKPLPLPAEVAKTPDTADETPEPHSNEEGHASDLLLQDMDTVQVRKLLGLDSHEGPAAPSTETLAQDEEESVNPAPAPRSRLFGR